MYGDVKCYIHNWHDVKISSIFIDFKGFEDWFIDMQLVFWFENVLIGKTFICIC